MFRPQIQKTSVLVSLASICLFCVYFATKDTIVDLNIDKDSLTAEEMEILIDNKDYKNVAVDKMIIFLSTLSDSMPRLDSSYIVSEYIDPNNTGLIFQQKIDSLSILRNIREVLDMGKGNKSFIKKIEKDFKLKFDSDIPKITLEDSTEYPEDGVSGTILDSILCYNLISGMTGEGFLSSKQTALKPNFSALFVNLLLEANISEGDTVAVAMTGSMPGANIALHAACEAMHVKPIIISSVGSSDYGAIHPQFTWLDMERVLFNAGHISIRSIAASLGGSGDLFKLRWGGNADVYGGSLGRELAQNALDRNYDKNKQLIPPKRKNLTNSIEYRKNKYESILPLSRYSAYINIGGGVASMGIGGNEKIGDVGVINLMDADETVDKNSVAYYFINKNIPIITIHTIQDLIKDVNGNSLMQYGGKEKYRPKEGPLFSFRYNMLTSWIALVIAFGSVLSVGVYSFKKIKEHMESYEPESIL